MKNADIRDAKDLHYLRVFQRIKKMLEKDSEPIERERALLLSLIDDCISKLEGPAF